MRGPTMVAIPKIDWSAARNIGRCLSGSEAAMIDSAPVAIPAPPKPAIARPTMSILLLTATPQMSEPVSNIPKKIKKMI